MLRSAALRFASNPSLSISGSICAVLTGFSHPKPGKYVPGRHEYARSNQKHVLTGPPLLSRALPNNPADRGLRSPLRPLSQSPSKVLVSQVKFGDTRK